MRLVVLNAAVATARDARARAATELLAVAMVEGLVTATEELQPHWAVSVVLAELELLCSRRQQYLRAFQ